MRMMYSIYKFESPSGKSYIGQTKNVRERLWGHKSSSNSCRLLKQAIDKYGWNHMNFEILHENLSLHQANAIERFYILYFNTIAPSGYNLTTGGDGYERHEETKILMSSIMRGRKRDPRVVERINKNPDKIRKTATKHKGMKRSKETCDRISVAKKQANADRGYSARTGCYSYYDPKDHNIHIFCLPEQAPSGWIRGNAKLKNTVPYMNRDGVIKRFHKDNLPTEEEWQAWNPNKK